MQRSSTSSGDRPAALSSALQPNAPASGGDGAFTPEHEELLTLLLKEATAQPQPSVDLSDRLVTLQGAGEGPSLFAVGVFHFQALAERLGTERPFYGLLGQDVNVEIPYLQQVGDLAKRYVEVLRRVQPEGPYHLVGFCFGGLVAYEIARQLRASGTPMGALVLVDAFPPSPADGTGSSSMQSGRLTRHWDALREGGGKYIVEWAKRRRAYERTRVQMLGKRVLLPLVSRSNEDPGWSRAMVGYEAEVAAASGYVPEPYEGDALIVAGTADLDRPVGGAFDVEHEAGRWRDYISGSVDVEIFRSEAHHDVLAEPLVGRLAALIQNEIAWASNKATDPQEDA